MERTYPKITTNARLGHHLEDELEHDDNHSARCSTFKHIEETMDQLQKCKVKMAIKSLQAAHKHLCILELNPDSFGNPTDYEKEQIERGTKMCFSRFSAPFLGVVLSSPEPIPDKDGHFYAIFTIVFGALALKLHKYNMAIDIFQRCSSLFTSDVTPRTKNNMEVIDIFIGLAKANIGCVYLITKMIDKAEDHLKCALEIFEKFKNQNKNVSVDINIVSIKTNLSTVYQCQKDYPAAVQLQDCLLLKAKELNLPVPLVAAIHYNRAELFLELKEPFKALTELNILDSLSERMNNEDGIFSKFISSKICLAYQMIGEVARAKKIAERLIFPSLSPKSASLPLSPSSKSCSSSAGSGSSSLSSSPSSSSSSSFSASTLMSSFSLFLPDFEAFLECYGKFNWDFLFAIILNVVDFHLKEENLDFVSFLDFFVPNCEEMLGENHPTYASVLYRQGFRFFLMERKLSSKNCFEQALSILTSSNFGSDHPDLVQCNIGLARLLLCKDFQEVRQLKSYPDRCRREFSCDAAADVVDPDIPSFREDSGKLNSNEELDELVQISAQGNHRGRQGDCLENDSQKDKNRGISVSQRILETSNVVCDGWNDALRASFHGGDVGTDSGENSDVLATNGACGFDKEWNTPVFAPPKRRDSHESNSKAKGSLGLKGGRQSNFPLGHGSHRDPSEDEFRTNHIGIDPSFLARHSYEYNASDAYLHSKYDRSGYMPEMYCPTPSSSSTYPGCPDAMGSPPKAYVSPDEYQHEEPSLNLVLMPKIVPAKTL
ncbi:uncharacterized protein LOC111328755 [Stylophora pistillata]|uniref:uncharacterized protein LOC111328755 n=1 Tax=Stylophora pistillata TaxID=50429 RepID=UPI000C03C0EF|nr:uncharacterized protein LOC111328755 [Stylophora pistillata]XP_022788987.1 uncharacterized protein LOC111328755 [Stylophora pistillata]XP_022788988.1 uncharacterized protein LOC111328755 [Stylophora pistillata]XP_022788989.1 uncharacterized protein LOC111328755 [Stylophora pistillata]XP_022788990.1 uncharacterized protein LOC111328755 [Stylophora pistillata]